MTQDLPDPGLNAEFRQYDEAQPFEGELSLSGGVVTLAGYTVDPNTQQAFPMVVFRFRTPDGGGFYPSIALVMDTGQMVELPKLVVNAVRAAATNAAMHNTGMGQRP